MHFPLPYIPQKSYRGGRGFGADRTGVAKKLGTCPGDVLKHGACDLMAPPGTPVLAIDDGVVLCNPYRFYDKTYAIEIQHTNFIARYCEIRRQTEVGLQSTVKAGQVIGYVGNQPGADMLHLELFSGARTGPLTTAKTVANQPFYRRKDMMDPTPVLDSLRHTVQSNSEDWTVVSRADGCKVVEARTLSLLDL